MTQTQTTRKIHCNRCKQKTNHLQYGSHTKVEEWGNDNELHDMTTAELYVCAGCEEPTLMVTDSGDYYPEDVEFQPDFFPPRNQSFRAVRPFRKLTPQLQRIYRETVHAVNSGSLLLCAIGLRALMEGVCDDKKATGKNLEAKIENLRQFFPSSNITDFLHGFRFSGNEAAHELVPLTLDEANSALDVIEGLLNYLYDLDYRASLIKHAQKQAKQAKSAQAKP